MAQNTGSHDSSFTNLVNVDKQTTTTQMRQEMILPAVKDQTMILMIKSLMMTLVIFYIQLVVLAGQIWTLSHPKFGKIFFPQHHPFQCQSSIQCFLCWLRKDPLHFSPKKINYFGFWSQRHNMEYFLHSHAGIFDK